MIDQNWYVCIIALYLVALLKLSLQYHRLLRSNSSCYIILPFLISHTFFYILAWVLEKFFLTILHLENSNSKSLIVYEDCLKWHHFSQKAVSEASVIWYPDLCYNMKDYAVASWSVHIVFRFVKQNCQLLRNLWGSKVYLFLWLPPQKKVNYQSWLESSLPPWRLTAANSLINLINVIIVGFGVGCHCSADSAIQPEHLPPHSVLLWFLKAVEWAIVSKAPALFLSAPGAVHCW